MAFHVNNDENNFSSVITANKLHIKPPEVFDISAISEVSNIRQL